MGDDLVWSAASLERKKVMINRPWPLQYLFGLCWSQSALRLTHYYQTYTLSKHSFGSLRISGPRRHRNNRANIPVPLSGLLKGMRLL